MHPEQVLIVADWFKQNAQWRSTFEAEVESSLLLNILVSLDSVLDALIVKTKISELCFRSSFRNQITTKNNRSPEITLLGLPVTSVQCCQIERAKFPQNIPKTLKISPNFM